MVTCLATGAALDAAIGPHRGKGSGKLGPVLLCLLPCAAASAFAVERSSDERKVVAAGAVPLLELFGIVTGGWQMARAALVARERLAQGVCEAAFL